jgi:hypothetical protein
MLDVFDGLVAVIRRRGGLLVDARHSFVVVLGKYFTRALDRLVTLIGINSTEHKRTCYRLNSERNMKLKARSWPSEEKGKRGSCTFALSKLYVLRKIVSFFWFFQGIKYIFAPPLSPKLKSTDAHFQPMIKNRATKTIV